MFKTFVIFARLYKFFLLDVTQWAAVRT